LNTAGLVLFLGVTLSTGGTGADEHLLAGARSFREGRFDEALVEFRVAQNLGSRDAAGYVAASLVKLDRPEEAIEAFGGVEAPGRDALLDYYRALACYDARLYLCADRILAEVGERSGPRIAAQARKIRADVAAVLTPEPGQASIDWYLSICSARLQAGRAVLAQAYCREAAELSGRRKDAYRRSDAVALLARLEENFARGRR
jgi:tetratricopeptide (TPR) repeat protein